MMKPDLNAIKPQKRLMTKVRMCEFLLAIVLLISSTSSVHAQIFDRVISRVIDDCAGIVPTGNLIPLCGAGIPSSGGSTTSLTRESTPIEERKVQQLMGPWNIYFAGDYERFNKDVTAFEPGYNTDTWRALAGADYSVSNSLLLGGALRYENNDGRFKGAGKFDTNSYGLLVHGTFVPAPRFFIDANAGYMRKNHSIERAVFVDFGGGDTLIGSARGKPDGNEVQVGVNGGYDFNFQNLTVGPRLGLNYKYNQIDSYAERGGSGLELRYDKQHEHSLRSMLGGLASLSFSTPIGVIVPQFTAEYVHEYLDPQRHIGFSFVNDASRVTFRFQNDRPDRDYFNLGFGIVFTLPRGFSPFVNYRALVGYKDQSSHKGTAGLRIEF